MNRGTKRALTLLEMVVAIALLLALAGIALPALLGTLGERRFDEAVDLVSAELLLARAHAQETHSSVEVVYEVNDTHAWIEARPFEAGRAREEMQAIGPDEEARPRIDEPWAIRALPTGVRIERGVDNAEEIHEEDEREQPTSADSRRTLRLVIFVPDGSALLVEPFRLLDDEGRGALWTIEMLTGMPNWEEIEEVEGAR